MSRIPATYFFLTISHGFLSVVYKGIHGEEVTRRSHFELAEVITGERDET